MARTKPVTADEMLRALMRIEDVRELAEDLVRRMNGKSSSVPTFPLEPVLEASTALAQLALYASLSRRLTDKDPPS